MSDESIVITVQDSIDATIEQKLDGISASAIGADLAITTLQENLNSLNASGIANLTANLEQVSLATDQLTMAQANALAAITALGEAQAQVTASGTELTAAQDLSAVSAVELEKVTVQLAAANEALTKAQTDSAISATKLGLAQDQAALASLKLANAQTGVASNTEISSRSIGNFGDTMERAAMRSLARFILITIAIQGTISAIEALYNATDKLNEVQNKFLDTQAKGAIGASEVGKSIRDEINIQKEGTQSYGEAGNEQTKLKDLKLELMAQGPEYRKMLQDETLSYGDILNKLKELDAQKIVDLKTNLAALNQKGPDESFGEKTLDALHKVQAAVASVLPSWAISNNVVTDSLDKLGKAAQLKSLGNFTEEVNKENGEIFKLQKGIDTLNGAFDKPNKQDDNRAKILEKTTEEIQKQINAFGLLDDAKQNSLLIDQTNIKLIGTGGKHHDLDTQQIADLTALNQKKLDGARVQSQLDSLYAAAINPLRDYNNALLAANTLVNNNKISQENYNTDIIKASESYLNSVIPLRQVNQGLTDQRNLLQYVGDEQKIETQLQQISNSELAKGHILSQVEVKDLQTRLLQISEENKINQAKNQIYDQTTGKMKTFEANLKALNDLTGTDLSKAKMSLFGDMFKNTKSDLDTQLDEYKNFLDQIKQLNDAGVLQDGEAKQLKAKASVEYWQSEYNTYAQGFSDLSTLMRSSNRTMFEIGKAAATAQAFILGTLSVMNCLANIPAPANFILAGTAALAAAVNIASIQSQQMPTYAAGGYTGDGDIGSIAGVTHGKEFVVNSNATAKNRATLEAMNAGKSVTASNSPVNVKIENYGTSKGFEVQQIDANTVRIIARDEANNAVNKNVPSLMASEIANPNSKTSKSLRQNTTSSVRR